MGGRRVRRWRRVLAAILAVLAAVVALRPGAPAEVGQPVMTLARDLPAGAVLGAGDLSPARQLRPPEGARSELGSVLGRVLAGPVRRGEVLTDVRLVPSTGPDPGPGRVAVPLRPADPGMLSLLSPGMHVAALAVDATGRGVVLAADAVVLALPPPPAGHPEQRMVVLSVPAGGADRLAATTLSGSIALRFT